MSYGRDTTQKVKTLTLLTLVLLCTSNPSTASQTPPTQHPLTLEESILLTIRQSPEIVSARLKLVMDRYHVNTQRQVFRLQPGLSLNSEFTTHTTPNYSAKPSFTLNTTLGSQISVDTHTLSLQQPLNKGLHRHINLTPLHNIIDQTTLNQLTYQQTLVDTVSKVIKTYYQALEAKHNIQIQHAALQESKKTLHNMQIYYRAGEIAKIALSEQNLLYLSEKIDDLSAQQSLNGALSTLKTIMDVASDTDITLSTLNWPPTKHPSLAQYLNLANTHNLSLRMGRLQLHVLDRNIKKAKDDLKWPVDLSISDNLDTHSRSANLSVTVPLNNYAAKQAYVQAINARAQAEENIRQVESDTRQLITNQYQTLEINRSKIPLAIKSVIQRQRLYRLTKKSVINGLTPAHELVSKKLKFIQAQQALFGYQIQYLNSLVDIQSLTGTLLPTYHIHMKAIL